MTKKKKKLKKQQKKAENTEVQTAKNWWKSGVGWGGMYAPTEEAAMDKKYRRREYYSH